MKRSSTIKPLRRNLPDFRNKERGKASLKAMIEQIELLDQKKQQGQVQLAQHRWSTSSSPTSKKANHDSNRHGHRKAPLRYHPRWP